MSDHHDADRSTADHQDPGWYPDPIGRAHRRWYDGATWTASVMDADGRQRSDHLSVAGSSAPTQAGADWTSNATPPPPALTAPATSSYPTTATAPAIDESRRAAPADRAPDTAALRLAMMITAGVGVVLVALSLFVLDWASAEGRSGGFGDLVADGADPAAFADKVMVWHFRWLGYVLAAAALAAVVMLLRAGAGRGLHLLAAVAAALGALLATFAIVRYFRGPGVDPEFGAWLLPAGYLVLLAAVVIGARTIRSRS